MQRHTSSIYNIYKNEHSNRRTNHSFLLEFSVLICCELSKPSNEVLLKRNWQKLLCISNFPNAVI